MLAGLAGRMGTGKTLSMTALGFALQIELQVPLYANYTLEGESVRIRTMKELMEAKTGIVLLDELWLSMDSRLWKDNVKLTRWLNQTRKKNLIILYTTQHISQVDIRVRRATDWLIMCDRNKQTKEITLTFTDFQYGFIGKKLTIHKPEEIYPLYNTFEVLEPLLMERPTYEKWKN